MSPLGPKAQPPPIEPSGARPAESSTHVPSRSRRATTPGSGTGRSRTGRAALFTASALVVLALARVISGADDLTSSGTAAAALRLAVPIALAGLSGIFAERSGVVNIGIEGMMVLGTWFGAWAAWNWNPWWGIAAGFVGGAMGGLVHAVATVTFNVDHVISGVAINILGPGVTRYLSGVVYTPETGGSTTQSPGVDGRIPTVDIPVLAGGRVFGWRSPDLLGWLEHHRWFLISDTAGLARGFTHQVSWASVGAMMMVGGSGWLLWHTKSGLRWRSVGENPQAAESLGVPVYRVKYLALLASGGVAGTGGAFLSVVATSSYLEGQVAGRGFIGLATMIFGNWRPGGLALGAGLFGYTDGLRLRSDAGIHGFLVVVGLTLCVLAARRIWKGRVATGIITALGGAVFLTWFARVDRVPNQLAYVTPYLVTLLVLITASQRLRPPNAAGRSYRRGDSH